MNDRISIYIKRSLTGIHAQAISDDKSILGAYYKFDKKSKPTDQSSAFGESFGKKLFEKKILKIRFVRGDSHYHGRVKAFADGMRKAGLEF